LFQYEEVQAIPEQKEIGLWSIFDPSKFEPTAFVKRPQLQQQVVVQWTAMTTIFLAAYQNSFLQH